MDRSKIEAIRKRIDKVKEPIEVYDDKVDKQLEWLYSKIDTFSAIDRALILLYLENKRYSEIAETLGVSKVNARVKMNRIKNRLKTMLKEENNG